MQPDPLASTTSPGKHSQWNDPISLTHLELQLWLPVAHSSMST